MKRFTVGLCMLLSIILVVVVFAETPKTGSYRWSDAQIFDGALTFNSTVTQTGNQAITGAQAITGNQTVSGTATITGALTTTAGLSAGGAADSFLLTDTVTISNAEIITLRASPKQLVAAPGAGKFLELVSVVLILDYGSEVLTESADNLVVEYGTSGADATGAIESTGFIDQAADQMNITLGAGIVTDTAADLVNNKLQLFNTGDGEIAGNASADTTMIAKVTYRIHASGL